MPSGWREIAGRKWYIRWWRQHHKDFPPYGALGETEIAPKKWYGTNAEGNSPEEALARLMEKLEAWTLNDSPPT